MGRDLVRAKFFTYLVLLSLAVLVLPATSWAANRYVRAGATGSQTGADWTNAHTALPASLVRGDVYYVAAGNYGAHVFNDALNGTQTIEIRAATSADHGTDTGWSPSYVGQAVFSAASAVSRVFDFRSSYYIINGQYRGADWRSGYGIRVSAANGNASDAVIGIGNQSSPHDYHDITLQYVDVEGSYAVSDTGPGEHGIYLGAVYNITIRRCYSHDVGRNPLQVRGSGGNWGLAGWFPTDNLTVEYCYFGKFGGSWTGSLRHTEIGVSDAVTNFVFRYNYVANGGSTAFFATPSGRSWNTGNWHNGPWYIYGNVWLYEKDDTRCGSGNGVFMGIGDISFDGDVWFINNTISNVRDGTPGCIRVGAGTGNPIIYGHDIALQTHTMYVYNNLLWGSYSGGSSMFVALTGPLISGTLVYDYNAYYQDGVGQSNNDTSANKQNVATGNPFTNWLANTPGSDFTVTANTNPGVNTSAQVPGNDVDMNGRERSTWTRGAFEFPGPSARPNPPTNLRVL